MLGTWEIAKLLRNNAIHTEVTKSLMLSVVLICYINTCLKSCKNDLGLITYLVIICWEYRTMSIVVHIKT